MTTHLTELRLDALANPQPPCLSLYQPTHRHRPANQQDPIRFRNLVRELETSLLLKYNGHDARMILEPFEKLAADASFWDHTLDGLAVLSAQGIFRVYKLQREVAPLAVVADTFHTKPLRRFLQSVDRYQVLTVTRHEIALYEGNRDSLDRVELAPGVPATITEALGEEVTEPHQTVASYGGAGGPAMVHGHGGKKDEVAIDEERFFRAVDRAVMTYHSRPSGLPLILATLPEHQAVFRRVSHNPALIAAGIPVHPNGMTVDAIRTLAWQAMEPEYLARLTALEEELGQARANALGSTDLVEVAHAAASGRVATLLIDADRTVPGLLDASTGRIERADFRGPDVDDLLDDLGNLVEGMGGRVVVVPSDRLPGKTGVAAIYRY